MPPAERETDATDGNAPSTPTLSVPPSTDTAPVKEFAALSVSVPSPFFVMPPEGDAASVTAFVIHGLP